MKGRETLYCFRCLYRITGADFERGHAFRVGARSACSACAMDLMPTLPRLVQAQIRQQCVEAMARKDLETRRHAVPGYEPLRIRRRPPRA